MHVSDHDASGSDDRERTSGDHGLNHDHLSRGAVILCFCSG